MNIPSNYSTKVGILLATYNQGAYLQDSISSLENQTFQDFTVLAIDDASTDGTAEILRGNKYEKIAKKVFLTKNIGIGNVVRRYLPMLNAEFVFVFCADDMLDPTYIEKCVNFLNNNPGYGAVATWIENFGARTDIMNHITEKNISLPAMLIKNNFLGSSLTRKKAMQQIGFGNKEKAFQKHNDYDRWVSILEKGWRLGVIKQPLFKYRRLSTSLSSSINVEDEIAFQRVFIKKHLALFRKYADQIILHHIEGSLRDGVWVQELKDGRDWLAAEYDRVSKENNRLIKEHEAVSDRRERQIIRRVVRKLVLPFSRNKR